MFLALILVLAAVVISRLSNQNKRVLGDEVVNTKSPSLVVNKTLLPYQEGALTAHWAEVEPDNVILLPNFDERLAASELLTKNDCELLINGGFYSKQNEPIGLFVHEKNKLSPYVSNQLFDGILSVNDFGVARILRNNEEDARFALQSGPILKENGVCQSISLVRDEPARRSVAAVSADNKLIFVIFYNPDSVFLGPWLSDLPEVLKSFEEAADIALADAVNLDGGAASAFYTQGVGVSEISPIGSFFCAK